MKDRATQLASIVLLVAVWALLARSVGGGGVVPGPADVVPDLMRIIPSGDFLVPLATTLSRTASGFSVAFLGGIAFGLVSAKSTLFRRSTAAIFGALLFAPALAIIFLGIAMLGTNTASITLITGLVVGPSVAIYMRDVLHDLDPGLLALADSYKVGVAQRVRDVYLPYLIPPMLGTSRIAFSMSWKIVMISEVFGFPGGLGFQIRIQYGIYNLSLLIAWLIVFVATLLVIEQLIRLTERLVVRWEA